MRNRAPLIGVLVALLLGVGFYFLLYQPRNDDLEVVHAETAELESQREALGRELSRLREIEEREVEFRAALARLEEYIPNGIAQSTLIRELQLVADQSGVVLNTVAFGGPEAVEEASPTGTPETVLGQVPVSVTVDGGYFQMVDFLRRVEVDVTRAVLLDTMSIGEHEDEFPKLASTFNGFMFAVIPDTALTSPPPDPDAVDGDVDGEDSEDGSDDEDDDTDDEDPGDVT